MKKSYKFGVSTPSKDASYRADFIASAKGRASQLYGSAKRRCKIRKKGVVTITKEWIESRINFGTCELTGLPFDLSPSKTETNRNLYSPSIDRIDNKNPDYSPENCRVVLTAVNLALNEFGLQEMLPIFKKLIEKATE